MENVKLYFFSDQEMSHCQKILSSCVSPWPRQGHDTSILSTIFLTQLELESESMGLILERVNLFESCGLSYIELGSDHSSPCQL